MNIKAVILAAGKSTRMQSDGFNIPKVMRLANGKPLLSYVLSAISFIPKNDIIIVAGYKKDDVIKSFSEYQFAVQEPQLGTGHAVMSASACLDGFDGSVLVCYGDMPALGAQTYKALIDLHFTQNNDCTMLTGESTLNLPYGRIMRDEAGAFLKTVEDRDCTAEEKNIKELNAGIYLFRAPLLLTALKRLKNENAQNEYYLTDVPAIIRDGGGKVGLCKLNLGREILGVNTADDLSMVEEFLKNDA